MRDDLPNAYITTSDRDITWVTCTAPYTLPRFLGYGMALASDANLIAITEAHTTFAPDWAEKVKQTHSTYDAPIIGGTVHLGSITTLASQALYFADYGQFLPPYHDIHAQEVAGNNVSFKRHILPNDLQVLRANGFWKTFYVEKLKSTGQDVIQIENIISYYNRQITFKQLIQRRLTHGRCFGGMRASDMSNAWRILFALAGLVLPTVLFWRQMRKLWKKTTYRKHILRASPLIFVAVLAWSLGEWWGTIMGKGKSCHYV